MIGATGSITVYRSADMNAEDDATAVRDALLAAGLHPELLGDTTPGVVEGSYEVRVPSSELAQAEAIVADLPADDPGAPDASHRLDLVAVVRTDGSTGEMEAMSIKNILDSNGIPAIIIGSSSLPNLGFEVRVPKDALEQARAAIAEAQAAGPAAAIEGERESESGK
ncbi:MAG TPA: hypothetical protein VMZ52_06655 [Bryobacteraceae bacterium]|nr:hypothetical protein [Bryobacteraceae bacterium]